MSSQSNTFLEHSNVFANGVEITGVYCEGCNKCVEFKVIQGGYCLADLDTCSCVRVNNRFGRPRIILETKGSILVKTDKMYDDEYDSEEDDDEEDEDEEYCFNMYVCQGCGKESEDPDFIECCEGHSVFAETRYSNDDDDEEEEEDGFSKWYEEKQEKEAKIKASWDKGISLQDVPDDITKMVWGFVAPNTALLHRKGRVSSIIAKFPRLLKTLNLGKMNKWNNRLIEEGERPFKETKKLIEINMCLHLRDYAYEHIFELYERVMVFKSNSTHFYRQHLTYLLRSDYWKDECEKAQEKARQKLLKKYIF